MLGKQLGRNQLILVDALGLIAGSGKLEKTKVRRNLIRARSLEGLLLFMYPNFIL